MQSKRMTKLLKAVCLFVKHASIIGRKTTVARIKNADVISGLKHGYTRKNAPMVNGKK
jgi:hypothetical protein